jgi:hypothetical protein
MNKRATIATTLIVTSHFDGNIQRPKQSQSVNLRQFGGQYSGAQRRPQTRHIKRLYCIRRAGVNTTVIFVSAGTAAVYSRFKTCSQKTEGRSDAFGILVSLTL